MRISTLVTTLTGVVLALASTSAFAQVDETLSVSRANDWSEEFTITVGDGGSLRVEISGGTGDADVYVRRGATPTLRDYEGAGTSEAWGRPYRWGNDELIERDNLEAGEYHIAVHAYEPFSGVRLTAKGTGGGGGGGGTGRPDKQAGEYAQRYGIDIVSPELGTKEVVLKQDGKERAGHSSSYLPISRGPLMREQDGQINRIVSRLIDGCDIFKDSIKDAAEENLPTSKKFDSAVETLTGRNPNYTDYYERNHYDPDAPGWTGMCHNWAPAGVLEEVAKMVWESDMVVGDQPIGVGDFRELVTALLPRVQNYFIGARNNTDENEDEDTDLDYADVVSALNYSLVDNSYGIVFDVTYTAEVWNQAVDRFTQEVTDATSDPALDGLIPGGGSAKRIKLTLPYVVEAGYAHRGDTYRRTMRLDGYLIEDSSGNVVDSKWVTSPNGRPDFMWIPRGLYQGSFFRLLKSLYDEGTKVEDMAAAAELCSTIEDFASTIANGGTPSEEAKAKIKSALAKAAPTIDNSKLDGIIQSTASNYNIDPSELEAAVSGP